MLPINLNVFEIMDLSIFKSTDYLFTFLTLSTTSTKSNRRKCDSVSFVSEIGKMAPALLTKPSQVVKPTPGGSVKRILINVSGTRFITTKQTLERFPYTALGKLIGDNSIKPRQEIFFDADDDVFREVLRYHRTGELHKPTHMCQNTFERQLALWGVDPEEVSMCCEETDLREEELERQFLWFEKRIEPKGEVLTKREHIWYFLTDPRGPYTEHKTAATAWAIFYIFVVVAQLINLSMSTMPSFSHVNDNLTIAEDLKKVFRDNCTSDLITMDNPNKFKTLNAIWSVQEGFLAFFFLELIIRISCCPGKTKLLRTIHMMDIVITCVEFLGVACVVIFPFTELIYQSGVCKFVKVITFTMTSVVTMRCFRPLALATVFGCVFIHILLILSSMSNFTVNIMSSPKFSFLRLWFTWTPF